MSVLAGSVLAGSGLEAAAGHKRMPRRTGDVDEEVYLKNSRYKRPWRRWNVEAATRIRSKHSLNSKHKQGAQADRHL